MTSNLNPHVKLSCFTHPIDIQKKFYVCDDGLTCIGGTKQRILSKWLPTLSHSEIVLVGTDLGLAQVALSMVTQTLGKKATLFMVSPKKEPENDLTLCARSYGADIHYPESADVTIAEILERAAAYTNEQPSVRLLAPPGLKSLPGSPIYEYFHAALNEALSGIPPPKILWHVCSTGFLGIMLHSIWPDTEFMIVVTDLRVWTPKDVENRKHQLFFSPLAFHESPAIQPPYETVPWYDGKVWEYVLQYGEDGDYIWNVGKVPDVSHLQVVPSSTAADVTQVPHEIPSPAVGYTPQQQQQSTC